MVEDKTKKKVKSTRVGLLCVVSVIPVLIGFYSGLWGMRKNSLEMTNLEKIPVVSEYKTALKDSAALDYFIRDMYSSHSSLERVSAFEEFPSLETEFRRLRDSVNTELEISHIFPEVNHYRELESKNSKTLQDRVYKGLIVAAGILGLGFLTRRKWLYQKSS